MALLRKPKNAPTKVKGTDTQNHKANKATKVKKGMAAEDPSYHKTRFMTKNRAKTTLKTKLTIICANPVNFVFVWVPVPGIRRCRFKNLCLIA